MARKTPKRRLAFFGTISIFIIVYFFYSSISYVIDIRNLKQESKRLSHELIELRDDAENLKLEITKLKDPEYVARYARENYLYSKNGEYIINIKEKNNTQIVESDDNSIIPYIIGGGVGLFIIFLYVVTKGSKKSNKKGNQK